MRCLLQTLGVGFSLGVFSFYLFLRSVTVIKTELSETALVVNMPSYVDTLHIPSRFKETMQGLVNANFSFPWQHPDGIQNALLNHTSNGFLMGNKTSLTFYSYGPDVDLRIIVIVFNRAKSLRKCLDSINAANYDNATVSLHVWIDRDSKTGDIHAETLQVAKSFNFTYAFGKYHVHLQGRHVGIQGQWTNTWRPLADTKEVAVIVEDDLTLSPYFWTWLKLAVSAYRHRSDISGYGLSGPGISHEDGRRMIIPGEEIVYLYRVICTWGYAPHPRSWRAYQDWFYKVEQDPHFRPLVPGILPTQWYLGERKRGRERALWEMWHIYYSHNSQPPQFTVMANTREDGYFAINRHEKGLHDTGNGIAVDKLFAGTWKTKYGVFQKCPNQYDYSGVVLNTDSC